MAEPKRSATATCAAALRGAGQRSGPRVLRKDAARMLPLARGRPNPRDLEIWPQSKTTYGRSLIMGNSGIWPRRQLIAMLGRRASRRGGRVKDDHRQDDAGQPW